MYSNKYKFAKAHIKGGKEFPEINGIVYFQEVRNGVILTAKINRLPQSPNNCNGRFLGFHIHDGDSCTGNSEDEFANAKL